MRYKERTVEKCAKEEGDHIFAAGRDFFFRCKIGTVLCATRARETVTFTRCIYRREPRKATRKFQRGGEIGFSLMRARNPTKCQSVLHREEKDRIYIIREEREIYSQNTSRNIMMRFCINTMKKYYYDT